VTAQVLLFDLDGCLVDSTVPITRCMNLALVQVGLPERDPAELVRFIGPPLPASFATMLAEADADPSLAPTCVEAYRAAYPQESLRTTRVVAGIPEVLAEVGRDAVLAVVTSKPRPFALPIVEHLGLLASFRAVHGPQTDLQGEPKAVTLRRALADVAPDADPTEVVMIGDREHDVLAGRACGTRTVGVTWGAGSVEELAAAGADHLAATPAELTAVLR